MGAEKQHKVKVLLGRSETIGEKKRGKNKKHSAKGGVSVPKRGTGEELRRRRAFPLTFVNRRERDNSPWGSVISEERGKIKKRIYPERREV